jgi:hypothetical protein
MPHAIIDWDQMSLHSTRHTPLTGDVKTVAALYVMPIASFQMINRCYSDSDMMVQDSPSVATMSQKVRVVRQVPLKDCGQMVVSPIMDRLLVLGIPVVSPIMDRLLVLGIPVVPLICLLGGAELLTPALHVTDIFCDATKNQWTTTCRTYRPL